MTMSYRSAPMSARPIPRTSCWTAGRMLCQTCLVSRYSSSPACPSSRPVPGLLVAAPLGLRHVRVVVVDPDRAHPQPGGHALALAGVLGPDRAGQPVDAVVGDRDRLVLVAERLDGEHRPERLVLGHRHRAGAAVEDGRQVVVAVGEVRVVGAGATTPEYGALGDAGGDVRLDLVAVRGAGQRPGLGLLVERAAEADPSGAVHDRVDELVVDRLLDDEPGAGRADLAGVQEHGGEREVERDLEIGVGEDDVGVLAAELQGDLLHGAGGGGHDPAAGLQAAGERHQVDARVGRQRGAGLGAGAEHEVADAGGESGLLEQLHQVDGGVRGELARLEHEGVAGGQAGRDLPGHLEERVVPRGDQAADADRLVDDPADDVGVAGVDDPAGLLRRDVAVVAEDGDDVGDVVLALDEALAGVERLHPRDRVGVALEEVGEAEQEVTALAAGGLRPGALVEGVVRGGDGLVGVLGAGLVHLGDEASVGRASDLAARSGARRPPRAAEVESCVQQTHSPQLLSCVSRNRLLSTQPPAASENAAGTPRRQAPDGGCDLTLTPAEPV